MIKKTIASVDFNGVERKEDYYFNLTKTEISKAQMSVDGGLTTKLQRIVDAQNAPEIMKVFEEFIDMSYGIKSDDGKRFIKSPEILAEFKSTAAYDELFMELISSTKNAIEFIKGILPSDMSQKIDEDPNLKKRLEEVK